MQAETAAHTRMIHGTATNHGITNTGIVSEPQNLLQNTFTSYSFADDQLVRGIGAGTADGTFEFPVAQGAQRWELADGQQSNPLPIVAVGDAEHPNLDTVALGRLDVVTALTPTPVTLGISDLEPWAAGDSTELLVDNTSGIIFSPELEFADAPATGDTTIGGVLDWSAQTPPTALVDAAKGDYVAIEQLVAHSSGTETWSSLERFGTRTGYSNTDGSASSLAVDVSPVAQTQHLDIRWDGAAFDALRAAAGPGATVDVGAAGVFIDTLPLADTYGFYANAPDLMLYSVTTPASNTHIDVAYGNPYASQGKPWDEYAIIDYPMSVPVQAGSAAPVGEPAGYFSNLAMSQVRSGAAVTPAISPVRDVRIDGKSLASAVAGVGTSPRITWDAPQLGNATQYIVSLEQITAQGGATVSTDIAQFQTKERSLRIPSDFLSPGSSYLVLIAAEDFGRVDQTVALFSDGLPFIDASMVTAQFTP